MMFSGVSLLAFTLFGLLYALRRRQESFRICFQHSELKVISGQPPKALLLFCRQLLQNGSTIKGSIRGLKKGEELILICSHSIPVGTRRDIYFFWQQQPAAVRTCPSSLPATLK